MSSPTSPAEFPDLRQTLSARYYALLALRAILFTSMLVVSVFGIAVLSESERGSGRHLEHSTLTYAIARRTAAASAKPLLIMTLLMECWLMLMVRARSSWRLMQILMPVAWAVAGACWANLMFPYEERGPKQNSLVSGMALLFFMSATSYLTMWRPMIGWSRASRFFPFAWHSIVIMLMATFWGAMTGWTDISPRVTQLLRYQEKRWLRAPNPPNDGERPYEEPWHQ